MWLQNGKIHNRHDVLWSTVAGEMSRTKKATVYSFINLTQASDLVSRRGLFNPLKKIGCPPKLLSVISSFHNNMNGTVNYDGATSEPFAVHSGVKQGCVLAPTLFSIFFSIMLSYAFKESTEGVFLHTRADGKLFNLARLRAKTKKDMMLH